MTSSVNLVPRKKVAIVGGGSAGIAALWALNRTHHDVYLYETADRLGGHTNTVEWKKGKFRTLVDTGFTVINTAAYPNFMNFLEKVSVPTVPTQMTFAFSRDKGRFEWASGSLDAIFSQRRNLFSPSMWRLVFDIIRFNKFALDLLRDEAAGSNMPTPPPDKLETIGHYLDRQGYSDAFRNGYLIPLAAAMWSTSPDMCALQFPIVMLVEPPSSKRSFDEARLANVRERTTVKHLSNENNGKVRLHLENGKTDVYDHVILATHGDQAFQIIAPSATEEEKAIMSNFHTSENTFVLHSDLSLMPKRRKAWSSWNYLTMSSPWTGKDIDRVSLTYNMNTLQHIPRQAFGDVLVTLNPIYEPKVETVQGRYSYSHPLYTPAAVQALEQLPKIQNKRGISFAGAWTGYGFHEDGFSSGLHVAVSHLGARLPFEFVDSAYSRGRQPELDIPERLFSKTKAQVSAQVKGMGHTMMNGKLA
ncbi:hypothetical protein NUW58_g9236 [Xylaria curta]|uniref:Uncharacterized protein n=1 Tax=Xylaria curta TaxID=42375 RepID=A0ACC1N027_9PEZI|nr:hypothetical protein NUW58_g9236 [Xylaria curta]